MKLKNMFMCQGVNADRSVIEPSSPNYFSLPAQLPNWPQPQGRGFSKGKINLGEIEVAEVTRFDFVWGSHLSHDKRKGVSFYKPKDIPEGFFSLGHYCQTNDKPLYGYVLVARDSATHNASNESEPVRSPALQMPHDYSLVWNSDDGMGTHDQPGYFWLPVPPPGYKALGFVVGNNREKPDVAEVRCVREDLVDNCEARGLLLETYSKSKNTDFKVWNIRPSDRGMLGRGVSVGTFFCSSLWNVGEEMPNACLKNFDSDWNAMPDLDQIYALIDHYGPTVFFHPKEVYLPSSVSWFFRNGALLFKAGQPNGEPIDAEGCNLPQGGTNDGQFWLDPSDERKETIKHGNLESSELYVHVKPALGGTFTDLAMWIFCPFNGPATLKVGPMNFSLGRTGEHKGDWEHITLRVSNFTGRLQSIYFSQHSGGVWVEAPDLEFIEGNKAAIYSSKSGHASYPHPGLYLQGPSQLGIGIRNDCARSNFTVDSSTQYQVVAAEYLGQIVTEPCWLQYMRVWGPRIVYDSRKEIDKLIKRMPSIIRGSVKKFFNKFPAEFFGEEGPTGPKEKNNWSGDERW